MIFFALAKIPLDFGIVLWAFFIARNTRRATDLIPGVNLPMQTISDVSLMKFALAGAVLFLLVQIFRGAYRMQNDYSVGESLGKLFVSSLSWFLFYIALVYLGNGYLYTTEIPRLVIFFAFWLIFFMAGGARFIFAMAQRVLHMYNLFPKTNIFLMGESDTDVCKFYRRDPRYAVTTGGKDALFAQIRTGELDEVVLLENDTDPKFFDEIVRLTRIYGTKLRFAQVNNRALLEHTTVRFVQDVPLVELDFVGLTPWGRVLKRGFDLVGSSILLILLSPLFIVIAILIKIEDRAGPAIYLNRRVGKNGSLFDLYKFRYIYWKYCVKDAYGVAPKADEALKFEEALKKEHDGRNWPLYKIENDPRKTRVGRFIEKYSIDELPQLWNVFIGNMSLVGPRPHQPREVELYDEWHKQVLTLKPGITGMAQTHGRHKNSFDQEVALDTYYIEHWSILLDIKILLRTVVVVLFRE